MHQCVHPLPPLIPSSALVLANMRVNLVDCQCQRFATLSVWMDGKFATLHKCGRQVDERSPLMTQILNQINWL